MVIHEKHPNVLQYKESKDKDEKNISKKLFIRKCFAKSLTSFYLCKKYWNSPILCIGVSLKENDLKSHSWIEENNIPILENSNEMQKIMEIA